MITFIKLIHLTKEKVSLVRTLFMARSVQMCMLVLMFVPCVAVSQIIEDMSTSNLAERFKKILNRSEIIIDAQVISKVSKWDSSEGGRGIYTTLKFKVLHTIKGNIKNNEFSIDQDGGEVGNRGLWVSDAIPYTLNRRAIYFFSRNKYNNSLYEISRDEINGRDIYIGYQGVDPDEYIDILKQSVTDTTVLPKYLDEVKKGAKTRKSVAPVYTPDHPHPMLRVVPRPWKNKQDSVEMSKVGRPKIDTTIDGGVK